MAEKSKSPWVWIGCGCAAIAGVGLVFIGAMTFFGIRTAREMADPEARHGKALSILSATTLPEGYETELALSVPFFGDVVVMEGGRGRSVFLKNLRADADLTAAFEDDDRFDEELRRAGVKIRRGQEVLARDAVRLGGAEVRYMLVDGNVRFNSSGRANFNFDEDDDDAEVSAVLLVRCSAEDQPLLGLWAGRRAGAEEAADASADQAALVSFVEAFGFCGP